MLCFYPFDIILACFHKVWWIIGTQQQCSVPFLQAALLSQPPPPSTLPSVSTASLWTITCLYPQLSSWYMLLSSVQHISYVPVCKRGKLIVFQCNLHPATSLKTADPVFSRGQVVNRKCCRSQFNQSRPRVMTVFCGQAPEIWTFFFSHR